jgi:Glycosyl transferases group 1
MTDVSSTNTTRILCLATQGHEHLDGQRIRDLLAPLGAESFLFDRGGKLRSALRLARAVRATRPQLIVMEGTGFAGGVTLIALDALLGVPFVFSSGDAVGPFLHLHSRLAGILGGRYERLLCRRCAGFIGWTPYLVGRALTLGAPRAMSAPGWSDATPRAGARERVRAQLGITEQVLVVGLAGSLNWSERAGYAYGAELISAIRRVERDDVAVCVLGDGSGRARLEALAGEDLGTRVHLPGRVPASEVADYLAAFDVGSLSQSVDQIGSFRYTIKLSEYLACGLPIVTGETPAAYDLDEGYMWRIPGAAPWSDTYISALAEFLERLSAADVATHRAALRERRSDPFDKAAQQQRMLAFIGDLLAARGYGP